MNNPKAKHNPPDSRATQANPLFVQTVGGDELEPFEKQSLAISRESLDISRRTYYIAILAFIAAAAAAIFVYAQVRIAQRALEFQNRPWISLENFRRTGGERVPNPDNPRDWRVTYDITNTGYSPAVRAVVHGFVTIDKDIYATFQREAPCRESDRESDDLKMPSLTVFREGPVTHDDVLSFREGDVPIVNGFDSMVMCISYRDGTTNKLHHTKMLFRAIIHFQNAAFDPKHPEIPPVEKFVLQDATTD